MLNTRFLPTYFFVIITAGNKVSQSFPWESGKERGREYQMVSNTIGSTLGVTRVVLSSQTKSRKVYFMRVNGHFILWDIEKLHCHHPIVWEVLFFLKKPDDYLESAEFQIWSPEVALDTLNKTSACLQQNSCISFSWIKSPFGKRIWSTPQS